MKRFLSGIVIMIAGLFALAAGARAETCVPKNFRKPLKWVPQLQLGRVIEFCSLAKKSA